MSNLSKLAALLDLSVDDLKTDKAKLYLDIATKRLEELLCFQLDDSSEERIFDSREGYRSLRVDPFQVIASVTIDGDTVDADEYSIAQWDDRNADWYNTIVFNDKMYADKEITVEADWGFGECMPADLLLLKARLYTMSMAESKQDSNVKRKAIEGFDVTYKDGSDTKYNLFVQDNAQIIGKYQTCNTGDIIHGKRFRDFYTGTLYISDY